MGQYSQCGAVPVWNVCPIFKGKSYEKQHKVGCFQTNQEEEFKMKLRSTLQLRHNYALGMFFLLYSKTRFYPMQSH